MRVARWCAAFAASMGGGIAATEPQQPTPSGSSGDYNRLPWRLGLLTQTNSTC